MKLELLCYEKDNLPEHWKPYYIYIISVDDKEVGRIVLREGSREERYYDGHIGYSIEEAYRGHRYSQKACLLLFSIAKKLGFHELVITCSPDNVASKKIIESLGFQYIETAMVPQYLHKYFEENERMKCIYIKNLDE